ncbi:hypothetical protein [Lusitaniella coriacea]|uniref:hypothetical protein n=1 Tax=Lusitaniella coriacea TaxID=1983105 RepID=UPI003CEA3615
MRYRLGRSRQHGQLLVCQVQIDGLRVTRRVGDTGNGQTPRRRKKSGDAEGTSAYPTDLAREC